MLHKSIRKFGLQMIVPHIFRAALLRGLILFSFLYTTILTSSGLAQEPLNDDFYFPTVLTGASVSLTTHNIGATFTADEPDVGEATIWFEWTASSNGLCFIDLKGSTFDTILGVYTGTVESDLEEISYNDDQGSTFVSALLFHARGGVTYKIVVGGFDGDEGTVKFSLQFSAHQTPPPNDSFNNPILLSGTNQFIRGTNVFATAENLERNHLSISSKKSVWFKWTCEQDGRYFFGTDGSTFDSLLAIYRGTNLNNLLFVVGDDDGGQLNAANITLNAKAGDSYYIVIDGVFGESGRYDLLFQRVFYKQAPAWKLDDLDGNEISSTNFISKVVVLNFWATWCGPCLEELPDLKALYSEYEAEGLVVIGVSTDTEGASLVKPFVENNGMNYPVLLTRLAVENAFGGVDSIPKTVIIDRQNRVIFSFSGRATKAQFEGILLPLLRDPEKIDLQVHRRPAGFLLRWPAASLDLQPGILTNFPSSSWTPVNEPIELKGNFFEMLIPSQGPGRVNIFKLR